MCWQIMHNNKGDKVNPNNKRNSNVKAKDAKAKMDYKIQCIESSIATLEKTVIEIKKNVLRMRNTLDAHINRQYAEIKVVEQDGEWGDYSGVFYVNDEDAKDVILNKAEAHFERYFKNGYHHQNKKLGLFLFSARSGRKLIKQMNTTEGEIE
ncbi:hypothetical protein CL614_07740 [archaeon]|nr:hypothetical protein [archaeon]